MNSTLILCKGSAAVMALIVVEYVRVKLFTHLSAGQPPGSSTCQAAQNRASQATQRNTHGASESTYKRAAFCASHSACCSARRAANGTNSAPDFPTMIARYNSKRTAGRTANTHHSDSCSKEDTQR
jgi:hypothetical protein